MERLSPSDVARRYVLADSEVEVEQVVRLVKEHPDARGVLGILAMNPDPEIRLWVADIAVEVLGSDAVQYLRTLTRDRDSDVRIEALNSLVKSQPAEARRMAKVIRRRVKSSDIYEAQSALWALGAMRDASALDLIRDAKSRNNAVPRNTAIVVEMLLMDPAELCRRIESHDHDLMPWLLKGAELLGTEEARAALARCAVEAPDEDCRQGAAAKLAKLRAA